MFIYSLKFINCYFSAARGKYDLTLFLLEVAEENWVFAGGMYCCLGGSDGAPNGPRWLIQAPWPLLRWVEMKK